MPPGKKNLPNGKAVAVRDNLQAALDGTQPENQDRAGNQTARKLRDLQNAVSSSIQDIDDGTK